MILSIGEHSSITGAELCVLWNIKTTNNTYVGRLFQIH